MMQAMRLLDEIWVMGFSGMLNNTLPLQRRLNTPFACTPVMLIIYTFCSDSHLMKLMIISNATFLPI